MPGLGGLVWRSRGGCHWAVGMCAEVFDGRSGPGGVRLDRMFLCLRIFSHPTSVPQTRYAPSQLRVGVRGERPGYCFVSSIVAMCAESRIYIYIFLVSGCFIVSPMLAGAWDTACLKPPTSTPPPLSPAHPPFFSLSPPPPSPHLLGPTRSRPDLRKKGAQECRQR